MACGCAAGAVSYTHLVTDREQISDCIDRIVDYAERSLPVLNDAGKLVGIIDVYKRQVFTVSTRSMPGAIMMLPFMSQFWS